MGADFSPTMSGYTGQGAFRYWCQKVLPLVYDDSLSYYELLNKVVNYLNNAIADIASVEGNVDALHTAYDNLQGYVNNTFEQVEHDYQAMVDAFADLTNYVDNYFNNLDVQNEINNKLDEMATNGTLSALLAPFVATEIPDIVAGWLSDHITPTSPAVDNTLSVSGAAADAKAVGDRAMITRTLESNADLNSVTLEGIYHIGTTLYSGLTNYPSDTYGKLIVFGSGTYKLNTVQLVVDHNNKLYWRIATSTTPNWSDWYCFNEPMNYCIRAIDNDADLNTLTQPGVYRIYTGNIETVSNYPSTTTGRLIVVASGTYANAAQIVIDLNNVIWWRTNTENAVDGWSDWVNNVADVEYNTFDILLEPGNLETTTSYAWCGEWQTMLSLTNLKRSICTLSRYNVGAAKNLTITWSPKNTTTENDVVTYKDILYLFQFDEDGNYVARSTSSPTTVDENGHATYNITLNNSTRQIAIKVYNNSGTYDMPNNTLKVTIDGSVFYKEKLPVLHGTYANSKWRRFPYYVGEYIDANGDVQRNYNTGMIMQARNYSANGKPTPVIIWVHGSKVYMTPDGRQDYTGTGPVDYEAYHEYLSDCGYNLIDCYGFTSRYWPAISEATEGDGLSNPWVMPTTCNAYLALIECVKKNFNVDENNIFITCKSVGGHVAAWLAYHAKVKAAGLLAPALRQAFGYLDGVYREVMIEDFGLKGTVASGTGWSWSTEADCLNDFINNYRIRDEDYGWLANNTVGSEKRIAFFQANEEAIMGCSEDFDGVSNVKAQKQLEWTAYIPLRNADNPQTYGDGMRSFSKVGYAPMKIWAAADDESISYGSCDAFVQELRNGGCAGVMRTMPNGTGGHHSVDSSPLALQKTNVTTPLGVHYDSIPLAYYELFEFFEKYRVK